MASMLSGSFSLGFMGLNATAGELEVNPKLPEGLPWLQVKHVNYRGGVYSVRADKVSVRIRTIKPARVKSQCRVGSMLVPLPDTGKEVTVRLN